MVAHRTIERLSVYRRIGTLMHGKGTMHVFSHELAARSGSTAAQVRRDLMLAGITGSPAKGYLVSALIARVNAVLDHPEGLQVALIGVGNLGRAFLAYFLGRKANLNIVAAFDADPAKVGRVIQGCRCLPMQDLVPTCRGLGVHVGLVTVPADQAQAVTDALLEAGVRGILNFAPAKIRVPEGVFVEHVDITALVEKVGYFAARQNKETP